MNKPLKIYNASAGSGKTYTLVQEYLRIVLFSDNPMKFRSILAMTFTNKAANEMKERILESLTELGRPEHEKNQKELNFLIDTSKNLGLSPRKIEERSAKILNRILHNYSSFSVMTIDKFTHKVIRTFAKDLNISIDFDVELDMQKLRRNITDLLFDQIGRDPELTRLMLSYANTNLSEDKSWNFSEQLFNFSNEIFKEEALQSIELLQKLKPNDFLKLQKEIIADNSKIEKQFERNAQEALDLIQSKGLSAEDFMGKRNSIVGFFKRVLGDLRKTPSATLMNYVEDDRWGHDKSPLKGSADEIGPLLKQYFAQIRDLQTYQLGTYLLNKEILKNLNNLSLLSHLLQLTEQIKSEENILLISDFYRKIAEVITEEPVPYIYERLGVRYAHFLLDEFQDTSHLQWINMIPLVHNSLASERTNLIVGDGKQAIYRWRNGEVEQFTGLPEQVFNPQNIASLNEAEPLFSALGERNNLGYNYRSAPEIVAFNNDLFPSFTNDLPEHLQKIYADMQQTPTRDFEGYVECILQPDLDETEQLKYIHETILKCLANGFQLKDICVLTRGNKQGATISGYLTERQLKVISPESLFIGKDLSVKFIVNVMAGLVHPHNKNYKIKAMEHFSNLILDQDARKTLNHLTDELNQKDLIDIFASFNYTIRPAHEFHNLFEYLDELIQTFDLSIATNPFLQFLLEQAHQFEKRNNSSPREFTQWFFERGHQTSIVSPEGADAIQVMTIHKSKGLQFPVVICPFTAWSMDINRQITWVENEANDLPAYFVKMSSTLEQTELSTVYDTEKGKFYLDHLNLLYVAFTRPEKALFICGQSKKRGKGNPVDKWLLGYFESSSLGSYSEGKFSLGKLASQEKKDEAENKTYSVIFHKKRMDKPVLSYKSAENWDIDELDAERLFGSKLHSILGEMKAQEDLTLALENARLKGTLTKEESTAIEKIIAALFEDDSFSNYFAIPREQQLNEKPIVQANGTRLIPDKILLTPENTVIVDFKTGQHSPSHKKQMQDYIHVLQDMGYTNVTGQLYYTERQEIIRL